MSDPSSEFNPCLQLRHLLQITSMSRKQGTNSCPNKAVQWWPMYFIFYLPEYRCQHWRTLIQDEQCPGSVYCSAQMRCETDRCSPCDGWKYSAASGKCYKYFEHFTSYKWATTVCDNRGHNGYQAELASVPNQATNDFIVSQFIEDKQNLENFQDFGLWLGGKMVSGQNGE